MSTTQISTELLKERIARRLSDYRIPPGSGSAGTLSIALARRVSRTFRAHWTGFKITYLKPTILLQARLSDGSFWSEGYISSHQPSWVLAFRKEPHKSRGSGGPRPEDQAAPEQHVETSLAQRRAQIEAGLVPDEELIRMEDYDDPIEAVDAFFNFTVLYMLKARRLEFSALGYEADPSIEWSKLAQVQADLPVEAAIDQGLKKSDIIWITPDTDPNRRPVPCWFVYTKEGRLFVLSGERQQTIPNVESVRDVHVVTRWKGRDVRLAEFDASVRPITASDASEFEEIATLLLNKRQSVRETTDASIERWKRECVILELTPRH